MNGKIFVISAPSGTGKTTIEKKIKKDLPDIKTVTSYTTRKPRPGEKNNVDYCFVSKAEFKKMIKENAFVEWAEVYGNFYGTPLRDIEENLKANKKILLTLDTQGGKKIKEKFPQAVLIALLPPSLLEQERRMKKRKGHNEKDAQKRLKAAREERNFLIKHYDYRVINKKLESTVEKIKKIIKGTDTFHHSS
jgi:guanylate kinase